MEQYPATQHSSLKQNSEYHKSLVEQYNRTFFELRFEESLPAPNQDQAKITQHKTRLQSLNKEIISTTEELIKLLEAHDQYIFRFHKQLKELSYEAEKTGINFVRAKKLKIKSVTDNQTQEIKINRVFFQRDDQDREFYDEYNPGEMMVEFTNEQGAATTLGFMEFQNEYLNHREAYEDKPLEAVSNEEKIALLFQPIAANQTFHNGTTTFKITEITEENGKKIIKLDKPIVKIPQSAFASERRHPANARDRIQQEFTPGEFQRLLKNQKYARVLQADEDHRAIQEKIKKNTNDQKFRVMLANHNLNPENPQDQAKIADLQRQGVIPTREAFESANAAQIQTPIYQGNTEGNIINHGQDPNAPTPDTPQAPTGPPPTPEEIAEAAANDDKDKNDKDKKGKKNPDEDDSIIKFEDAILSANQADIERINEFLPQVEKGFLAQLWADTSFLSIEDIGKIFKVMIDFVKTRMDTRQNIRTGRIGEKLPYFGTEFKKLKAAGLSEYFGKIKSYLDTAGIPEVIEIARNPSDPVWLKVALTILSEKGHMRWEDIEIWKAINKFAPRDKQIPIPSNGDYRTKLEDGTTGADYIQRAIDGIWGEGEYAGFKTNSESSYQSKVDSAKNTVDEVAAENNHSGELTKLLKRHRAGEYIDPHYYEAILAHAIEKGFSEPNSNIYFLVHGLGTPGGPFNRPILNFKRRTKFGNPNNYPLLQYFATDRNRPDTGQTSRISEEDFQLWAKMFDAVPDHRPGEKDYCVPSKNVHEFLWKEVMTSKAFNDRIDRAVNQAAFDFYDAAFFIPPANESQINTISGSAGGARPALSNTHYKNVIPGYSQYIKTLATVKGKDAGKKLASSIAGFMRYQGIMTRKYKPEDLFYRFAPEDYGQADAGSISNRDYMNETQTAIKKVITAYESQGNPHASKLNGLYETIYGTQYQKENTELYKKQIEKVNLAFEKFANTLNDMVKSDNGELMKKAIQESQMTGMKYQSPAELREKKKRAQSEAAAAA